MDKVAPASLSNPTPELWFDTEAFIPVPAGSYRVGTSGRNILDGPGLAQANIALSRQFRINERKSFQLRWEVFNVTNHTNFLLPNTSVDVAAGGGVTSANDARIMQLGLKYIF